MPARHSIACLAAGASRVCESRRVVPDAKIVPHVNSRLLAGITKCGERYRSASPSRCRRRLPKSTGATRRSASCAPISMRGSSMPLADQSADELRPRRDSGEMDRDLVEIDECVCPKVRLAASSQYGVRFTRTRAAVALPQESPCSSPSSPASLSPFVPPCARSAPPRVTRRGARPDSSSLSSWCGEAVQVEANPQRIRYPDAAQLLAIPIGTLRSMVCRRQVPHIRLSPRIVVFDVGALEGWIAARSVPIANDNNERERMGSLGACVGEIQQAHEPSRGGV